MLLSKAAGNHSGLNTAAYKSLVSVCTMKPFADPGPEENAKFASCSYNGYNGHTAAATARAMRQLLPVCIRIPPPWIIHISLMPRVQCHATRRHVSRVTCAVWSVHAVTTFSHPAPAQPAATARTSLQNIIKLNPIYVLRKNKKPQMKSLRCI